MELEYAFSLLLNAALCFALIAIDIQRNRNKKKYELLKISTNERIEYCKKMLYEKENEIISLKNINEKLKAANLKWSKLANDNLENLGDEKITVMRLTSDDFRVKKALRMYLINHPNDKFVSEITKEKFLIKGEVGEKTWERFEKLRNEILK